MERKLESEMANSSESKTVLPIFIVDAFTKQAFSGNAAAVCLLNFQQDISDDVKQKIAAEMNLSQTAFLSILNEGDTFQNGKRFRLKWFSPVCEIPLCGHATMGTSAVLFSLYNNQSPVIEFETVSGVLKARKLPDERIELNFPVYESKPIDIKKYENLVKATIGSLPFQEVRFYPIGNVLVRLDDSVTLQQLKEIKPRDADMLAAASNLIGIIVTMKGSATGDNEGNGYDFFSRYFAPWVAVSEDPVCGSAHCGLTVYWSEVLKKDEMVARQCSKRGGDVYIKRMGNRVALSSFAVVVVQGQIKF